MTVLSKSRLLSLRQCPRRLWLELHQPELREDSGQTQASFKTGHAVGAIARRLYDVDGNGVELDPSQIGIGAVIARTTELLRENRPVFEAGFSNGHGTLGAMALADVLLPDPVRRGAARTWRMVEVKSTTSVKSYHRDDAAIQYHVASEAGVRLSGLAVAHINSGWTYPGGSDFQGLFTEVDLTDEVTERRAEVQGWIVEGHRIARSRQAPAMRPGRHCGEPYECGFIGHCNGLEDEAHGHVVRPVSWLPRIQTKALRAHLADGAVRAMDDVPDGLLNAQQLRVKQQTFSGETFFDAEGAAAALRLHRLPALFLDFETIASAVPLWAGTRPYQAVPFQFSLHRLSARGALEHSGFLDVSGNDPRAGFAQALAAACAGTQPVFVYNRSFEGARIKELATSFPALADSLLAIRERLVDLEPVARAFYYAPSQQGSWSIKVVLPAIAPELRYDSLEGVQDGGGAQTGYLEAIDAETLPTRREELHQQLWRYCRLDTFAMVRVWAFLAGRPDIGTADPVASRDLTH